MNLTVIRNDSSKVNKADLYYSAYKRVLAGYKDNTDQDQKKIIKKLIFYGVNVVNRRGLDMEPIERRFQFADIVKDLMSSLTPGEFMNIFPVTKEYDGDRWETKDYFYTMAYINGLDQGEPIGTEIMNFLWEYRNISVQMFLVHLMGFMSDLRKLEGYPGILEEWATENGIETYTIHTDGKGKKFATDSHGRTTRVKPSFPRYLRVVQ